MLHLTTGTALNGSTVEMVTLTGYVLANGEFASFVAVHGLKPATPLVVLGQQVAV